MSYRILFIGKSFLFVPFQLARWDLPCSSEPRDPRSAARFGTRKSCLHSDPGNKTHFNHQMSMPAKVFVAFGCCDTACL